MIPWLELAAIIATIPHLVPPPILLTSCSIVVAALIWNSYL
jgi:hypothetical protein